eukprot:10823171-Ditylum_brightwellii.AAC.1
MGYYHIEISPESSALCTIVLPWGKYKYLKLPMGLCNSPDIFQEKITKMFADIKDAHVYIDDLLLITNGSWENYLGKLNKQSPSTTSPADVRGNTMEIDVH